MNEKLKEFLTIDDFDLYGKTVLFRADINSVIIDGQVQMKERIVENAKTIQKLLDKKSEGGYPRILHYPLLHLHLPVYNHRVYVRPKEHCFSV